MQTCVNNPTSFNIVVAIICVGNVETVPYTKRIQFLLIPLTSERVGVSRFMWIKHAFVGNVLPEIHPESVRVTKILKHVVEALQLTGTTKHKGLRFVGLLGMIFSTREAFEWDWEVLVVKDDDEYACCLPSGKFVVYTGMLDRFTTDEEIATIIAHEVAHVMARHIAEKFTKYYFWRFFAPFTSTYDSYDSALNPPFSLRMEIEADYIGLLLIASAGYDPRVAPKVLKKLGHASGDWDFGDYFSIHPLGKGNGKTRSNSLSKGSVMLEAISIYEEAKARGEVDT